jgi:hypothetical protein
MILIHGNRSYALYSRTCGETPSPHECARQDLVGDHDERSPNDRRRLRFLSMNQLLLPSRHPGEGREPLSANANADQESVTWVGGSRPAPG